jgi:transcriptional regulator with XRE-family HTH domain
MVPADPALRGRLFCAARALLGWTQARVACEAGLPTGTVAAVEIGRRGERAAAVPAILGALDRAGVRVATAEAAGGAGAPGICGVQAVVPKLIPVPFSMHRPGMTQREEALFALAMALRRVPAGVWRDLGKRRLPGDALPERVATEAILEHLERAGWRLEHRPPPQERPSLHSKIG